MTEAKSLTGPSRRSVLGAAAAGAALSAWRSPAAAQSATDALSPAAMRSDIRLLRHAYGTLHPGLYRYATPEQTAERFVRLEADCARPMSLEAFYLRLSRLLTTVKCGHTYANFYNQSDPVAEKLFGRADRLPFQFLWLDGRMIVTGDPAQSGLKPGDEIVRLNGRPAGEVLTALMGVARADGGNDAKRRRLMSVQGQDAYESFDVFYPLIFGSHARHALVVEGADGRRRSMTVASISLADRRAQRRQTDTRGDQPVWTMERRGDAALLTMPDWGLYNSRWDWRGWLDAEMDRLVSDGVTRLVVDIRANEGGLDCGDALAARLTDRPIPPRSGRRLVRYRRIPEDLRPFLSTWDRSFDDWGEDARPFDDRYFTLAQSAEEGGVISPRGPRFEGQVRVLTGPQNSSATFGFAEMMKREHLGSLWGETTGGNRRGINGGAFYFLQLPATGLEADLPLIGYFPLEPQPDAGVEPDAPRPLTRAQIAAGRDGVLESALG